MAEAASFHMNMHMCKCSIHNHPSSASPTLHTNQKKIVIEFSYCKSNMQAYCKFSICLWNKGMSSVWWVLCTYNSAWEMQSGEVKGYYHLAKASLGCVRPRSQCPSPIPKRQEYNSKCNKTRCLTLFKVLFNQINLFCFKYKWEISQIEK